ncbi:MAG: metallophosphoesterase [Planctomycetota bacterium]|nr:metallophosphoesterase [Planctomycetota bacterium]
MKQSLRHPWLLTWLLGWLLLSGVLFGCLALHTGLVSGEVRGIADGAAARAGLTFAWVLCTPVIFFLRFLIGPVAYVSLWIHALSALLTAGAIVGACRVFLTMRRRFATRSRAKSTATQDARADQKPDAPSRRRFLVDGAAAAIVGPATSTLAIGTIVTPWDLVIARYRVPIRDLPGELDGLRLVQISDTHLGRFIPASFISEAVSKAIELRPDVVVLTGDYVFGGAEFIARAVPLFAPLIANLPGVPVLGVLGNHDWYADGPRIRRELEAIGVRMLDNTRVYLDARTRHVSELYSGTPSLCVAGVGDYWTDRVDLRAALDGVPADVPRLLLSHNPDVAEYPLPQSAVRVDLMLSGHTHGGQVRLPWLGARFVPSQYGQKYAGGLVQGPACPVVISRGVGMSVTPVRFRVPPEVVEITLTRQA